MIKAIWTWDCAIHKVVSSPIFPLSFIGGCLPQLCFCDGISQNPSGDNLRHFVSARRLCDFGRARKTSYRFVVSKKNKKQWEHDGSKSESKIEVTVRSCCEKQFKRKDFARGAKVLRLLHKCSKANSDKL